MERPKLTPEQVAQAASTLQTRHQAYKKALEYLANTEHYEYPYPFKGANSLCWAISLGIMPECGNIDDFDMSLFPEVAAHKPVTQNVISAYWFRDNEEGYENRKEILLQAIEETATNPKDIRTDHDFMNSVFRNSESETILRNILLLQKSVNPDIWTPFSWDQYVAFCSHKVTESERGVLEAFVNGGKPVFNTSAYLTPGWLDFDGTNYSFTPQMIDMVAERYTDV